MSPSTQGSPKVPDSDCICQGTGLVTRLTKTGNTGAELCDCVAPVSALLSDETLGYVANELERLGWQLPANGAETCADLRAALSDAIEQVGGGQGE